MQLFARIAKAQNILESVCLSIGHVGKVLEFENIQEGGIQGHSVVWAQRSQEPRGRHTLSAGYASNGECRLWQFQIT